MKKTIFVIIILLLIVIAGAVFYVLNNLDALVEAAIEEYGSDAVKTSVQVEEVEIRLTEGAATINGLSIANPDGFSLPQAFVLGEITLDINLEKTHQELIAIDAVNVAAAQVFYEIDEEGNGSLNMLKDNLGMGAGTSTGTSVDDKPSKDSAGTPIRLDISRFEFKDTSLHAKVVPLKDKTYDLMLPALVLTDLSGTTEQISRQVLDKLIDHAKKEIRKQGLDKELAELKAKAQQRVDEEKEKLEQQADDRVEQEKRKAQDKLNNLLGR